jgi:3-oxoacyl-[acyl-carrier protein] reductase
VVTGGTGGIGRHITSAFADDGARIAITSRNADVDPERAQVAVPLDLEDPASAEAAVGAAIRELGGLDTFVVNAVRWPTQTSTGFEDLPADEWRAVLRANIEGAFAVTQAALPALRASGRGRIVLISSGAAEEGHPVSPHYVAAKAALHGLGRALAWDAGGDGVLTNVVAVGFTRTERNRDRFPDELFERAGALTPRRRVSTAEHVARVVLWLGSDSNTSVTGEVIREGTSAARTPLVALA